MIAIDTNSEPAIKYVIEQQGDAYYLYSIVKTNFGGDAKNLMRMSANPKDLEETVKRLLNG